jgi:hypothetical protein
MKRNKLKDAGTVLNFIHEGDEDLFTKADCINALEELAKENLRLYDELCSLRTKTLIERYDLYMSELKKKK